MNKIEIKVPDIGDFEQVPVIEVLVKSGDSVAAEQPLVTLESDKATMEVPSTSAGQVVYVHVQVGDEVSEGDVIATLEVATAKDQSDAASASADETDTSAATEQADQADNASNGAKYDCDLLVLGAGPGGYTAAFRAADLGLDVILIERYPRLGGVCLNVGCIPSKALLHTGKVIDEAADMAEHGVSFGAPSIDLERLRGWKDGVVGKLTQGLDGLAKKRKVRVITGAAKFADAHTVSVKSASGSQHIRFAQCVVAAGSEAVHLPNLRRPRHGFHQGAEAAGHSGHAADHRRRHHRPGDGLHLPRPGQRGLRGRTGR